MGKIKQGDNEFTLAAHTSVGRSAENELVLSGDEISGYHATIDWADSKHWIVRDLGSTNGTYVDGERLSSGAAKRLSEGNTIQFAENEQWVIVETESPSLEAVDTLTGERRVAKNGMLLLSSDEDDLVEIVKNSSGMWNLERNSNSKVVKNGDVVPCGSSVWKIKLPTVMDRTTPLSNAPPPVSSRLADAEFGFFVSQDLEYVRLRIRLDDNEWISERAHNWMLLQMAKVRIDEENNPAVNANEKGWVYVDELCTLAGFDSESHLNVEIHRARKEMAKLGVPEPSTVVERRRGTGRVRIGTARLEIEYAGR